MNKSQVTTKLRHSKQREKIYSYLCGTKSHPSADMIYEDLKGELENLSLGTVYRNLGVLEQTGKISCVATTEGTQRFDADCSPHAHFVCRCCGSVIDLKVVDVDTVCELCGADADKKVELVSVVLTGVCKNCKQKEESNG